MSRETTDAVVVGSGPNGLAAAVTMARAGLDVHLIEAETTLGGGARTVDLGLASGVRHDLCSAVHPLATRSPFLREFDLAARGVELRAPEVSYAQPLDGARAGLAYRDLERTVRELGADGRVWRRLFGPLVDDEDAVIALTLGDLRRIPAEARTPGGLRAAAALGLGMLGQGGPAWNVPFTQDVAPALFTGVAAHAISPMPALVPAGVALMLGTLAHTGGWTIPVGGSQAITDALLADVRRHGGRVTTGWRITDYRQLPRARAYLFDTGARGLLEIWGGRLPSAVRRRLARFRYGDAAAKVDFVLSGPVPWRNPGVGAAATVHLGGTREQMRRAESDVSRGRHAAAPVTLLSDPTVADPSRASGNLRPLWTYAHVPRGSTRDVTADVIGQIERFAPGFRDVVVASQCIPAAELPRHNANYVGGDIAGGAMGLRRVVLGATGGWDPYATGIPGVYLCSSATPPGPGVHGMSGWFAARRALRDRFDLPAPSLAPSGEQSSP